MSVNLRNLDWLRSADMNAKDTPARLHEMMKDVRSALSTLEQQTNSNLSGIPAPPPRLQAVTATPTSVGHHVSINHGAEFYRGAYYHVEYADNPHFSNPFPAYSGPAREIDLATGSQKLYFQAFTSYQNSHPSSVVFHGGLTPEAVTGGTTAPRSASQGSGTSRPGEGRAGFGSVLYRGSKPPERGTS